MVHVKTLSSSRGNQQVALHFCADLSSFFTSSLAKSCFSTAHLKKLMSEEKCTEEKAKEMDDVITQVRRHIYKVIVLGLVYVYIQYI